MANSAIKGFLFDLDGVFYVGDQLIDGALDAISYLNAKQIPHRFITNTSTLAKHELLAKLAKLGLPIASKDLITAPMAAAQYLKQQQKRNCHLVLRENVKIDFEGIVDANENVDAIVIGDIGDQWNYALLNQLFHEMLADATLIAIHKNKYWRTETGLQVDIGLFVAGLEYVTGTKAIMMGKPSKEFFMTVLNELHLPAKQVAVIGDDIDSDVGGALACGMQGILVQTGKYTDDTLEKSSITPTKVIKSITELPNLFE